ncbi:uncharacterized protein LY79DRAFT_285836 [Colletotrichum navitas]|uniref:Uncharacterized protein n=1 Tax=Colletotrichum navitas TaxID=681940 RepID=A0AAD8QA96_9PEZI|nr:uncharacterized protein LY79DRAFT_285836 [Colletotrichum navitas]KAK1598316.1 hypothetical protein LY79DRAFT_285836 [Colletotrichum navitas]
MGGGVVAASALRYPRYCTPYSQRDISTDTGRTVPTANHLQTIDTCPSSGAQGLPIRRRDMGDLANARGKIHRPPNPPSLPGQTSQPRLFEAHGWLRTRTDRSPGMQSCAAGVSAPTTRLIVSDCTSAQTICTSLPSSFKWPTMVSSARDRDLWFGKGMLCTSKRTWCLRPTDNPELRPPPSAPGKLSFPLSTFLGV